jgi:hypothetical protein
MYIFGMNFSPLIHINKLKRGTFTQLVTHPTEMWFHMKQSCWSTWIDLLFLVCNRAQHFPSNLYPYPHHNHQQRSMPTHAHPCYLNCTCVLKFYVMCIICLHSPSLGWIGQIKGPGRALRHVFNNPSATKGYLSCGYLSKKLELFTPYQYI